MQPENHQQPHAACLKCGGPTTTPSPPPHPLWSPSDPSPPPAYIPIRLPAVNIAADSILKSQQSIISSPIPQSSPILPASPPFHFRSPSKHISSPSDALRFLNSPSGSNFLAFIVSLSDSVRSLKISDPCPVSATLTSILRLLDDLLHSIDDIPPAEHSSRYGNLSFRVWHSRMTSNSLDSILEILSTHTDPDLRSAAVEITPYFADSFGNSTRIDYGTGHETNFAAWLYCLARLGLITEEDYQGVVTRVFVKYLELMRKLQLTYSLEPAGSHGVWGLDDYHFLPFVFGSSQLIDHKYMKPKSIHNEDILENFSKEYMYLSCIQFIRKVKTGVFAEHSPLLDDISGVQKWSKVNGGMLKMYRAEVLEKVPVMQHFLFGSLIKWEEE